MENSAQTITTTILTNMKLLVLTITTILLTGVILGLLIIKFSLFFGLAILIITCLSLIIFQKQIRKNFVEEVTVKLNNDYISLTIFDRNSYASKIYNIAFSEMSSLKVIESSGDDSSFIKFYHTDGTKSGYRFLDQKRNGVNIVTSTLKFVKTYNETKNNAERIYLRKTFIASKSGYRIIVGLIITAIISVTIYKPSVFPALLFPSLLLYLDIWAQRQVALKAKI